MSEPNKDAVIASQNGVGEGSGGEKSHQSSLTAIDRVGASPSGSNHTPAQQPPLSAPSQELEPRKSPKAPKVTAYDIEPDSLPWGWILVTLLLIAGGYALYKSPRALDITKRKSPATSPKPAAPSRLDTLSEHLRGARVAFDRAALEGNPAVLKRLESSCTQGRCELLSTCEPRSQARFNQLVDLEHVRATPEANAARFALHFHSCAVPALRAELIKLRELSTSTSPRLAGVLQQLRATDVPWGLCVAQGDIQTFEGLRAVISEATKLSSGQLFTDDDVYKRSIKELLTSSLKRPNQTKDLIGGLLRAGSYYQLEGDLSARFASVLEVARRALKSPEELCER